MGYMFSVVGVRCWMCSEMWVEGINMYVCFWYCMNNFESAYGCIYE